MGVEYLSFEYGVVASFVESDFADNFPSFITRLPMAFSWI